MRNAVATEAQTRSGGVGHSSATEAEAAGREAVRAALGGQTPRREDLVFIFPSATYDLQALHRAAMAEAAPASLVGATSCGQVFTHQAQSSRGCAAAWIPAEEDETSFGVCHLERVDDDIAGTARQAAETARDRADERYPHSVLLILSDGLTPDQRLVALGAYEVTGATVPLVGGAAGDDFLWKETHTFGEGVMRTNGILAVWLNSRRPMGVSIDHGWRPIGRPMLVTRADGTIIRELDGRPALDAYLSERGGDVDPDDPEFIKDTLEHPVGLPNSQGRYDVRQLHASLPEGGGLNFNTGMPEQTVLQVMTSEPESLVQGAGRAASTAIAQVGQTARVALVFSCGSRIALLNERVGDEIAAISAGLEGAPACGLFTFGEFARVLGSTGVHNSSVAILAL